MKIIRKQYADLSTLNDLDDITFRMAAACWNAVTIWEALGDPEHWSWKFDFPDDNDEVARFDRAVDEMARHQQAFTAERKALKQRYAELDKALA